MRKIEVPQSKELSISQMLVAIPLLKARLVDLDADEKNLIVGGEPVCKALTVKVNGTLADILGIGTQEYAMHASHIQYVTPNWSHNKSGVNEIHGIAEAKGKIQALLDRFIEKCQPANDNKIKQCTENLVGFVETLKKPFDKKQVGIMIEGIIESYFRLK